MTTQLLLAAILTLATSVAAQTETTLKVHEAGVDQSKDTITVQSGYSVAVSCPPATNMQITDPSLSTGFVESHILLTLHEALSWDKVVRQFEYAVDQMNTVEEQIIVAHRLTEAKDCMEHIGIRMDENYIFDSVPDNPKWRGWGTAVDCGTRLAAKRRAAHYLADGTPAPHNTEATK